MLYTYQLSRHFRYIANLYVKILSKELHDLDIHNYFDILLVIGQHNYKLSQKNLADLLHIDKSQLVYIIYTLTGKGLIEVKQNPTDRRENFIFLSPKGHTVVDEIRVVESKIHQELFEGIEHKKTSTFIEVLDILEDSLKKMNSI